MQFDPTKLSFTFRIEEFPKDIQDTLLSTLDINGFISNESKFRDTIANSVSLLPDISPKAAEKLKTIIKGGQLLPLERDVEAPMFGYNFLLNKYQFSLDVVPGKAETRKEGTKVLSVIGIDKQSSDYLLAYEDENGEYRYAGRVQPFLSREKLFVEPIEETETTIWIDPKKFKKVKVKHTGLQIGLQDTFAINGTVTKKGKKLSALTKGIEAIEFVEESSSVNQLLKQSVAMSAAWNVYQLTPDEHFIQACNDNHPSKETANKCAERKSLEQPDTLFIATEDPSELEPTSLVWYNGESTPIDQIYGSINKEAKMPSLKEIQRIVKDKNWQALREDLSWTKDNISGSLSRLRKYLGKSPTHDRKVRVLNLLNGVARGGIMTPEIERMQNRLRRQLDVGGKEASLFTFDPNSTEHEGRWRLRDPKEFNQESFRRWNEWANIEAPKGIQFLVGELKDTGHKALQAIRFDKALWDEKAAGQFWDSVRKKPGFKRTWSWKTSALEQHFEKDNPLIAVIDQWKGTTNIKAGEYEDFIGKSDKGEPLVVTYKIDGELAAWSYDNGKIQFISKEGRVREGLPVEEELAKLLSKYKKAVGFGELYAVDKEGNALPYPKAVSILRKPLSSKDESRIKLAVIDIKSLDDKEVQGDYWERFLLIQNLLGAGKLVHPVVAAKGDESTIQKMWEKGVAPGTYEGLVIHQNGVIKLKPVLTQDLAVIGIERSKKHPQEMGALQLAYMDEKGNFRGAGKVGTGFSDQDRADWMAYALKNKVREDDGTIWIYPDRVVEVHSIELNVRKTPLYNNKLEQIGEDTSAVGRHPRFIRIRDDKKINPQDLRLNQVPELSKEAAIQKRICAWCKKKLGETQADKPGATHGICKECIRKYFPEDADEVEKLNKTADFPKHPDTVIVKPNEFYKEGLTERNIWEYYDRVQGSLLKEIRNNPTLIVTTADGSLVRRKDPKTGELIKPISIKDIETLNNGRNAEFHRVIANKTTDRIWVDIDPKEDFPWNKVKEVTAAIRDVVAKLPEVERTEVRFSGGRGFHVYGFLSTPANVDNARAMLRGVLDKEIVPNFENTTTGLAKNSNMARLDVTTLHESGSLRAEYSLNSKTGLVCLNIDKVGKPLDDLEKTDFTIDKVLTEKSATASLESKLLEKLAHCGPCSLIKKEVIFLLSDTNYKAPGSIPDDKLCALVKSAEELYLDSFIKIMEEILPTLKDEKLQKKLEQMSSSLKDINKHLHDGTMKALDKPGVKKEGELVVFSAEYQWSYSPIKSGRYGRLTWLVPAILDQSRVKDDKWDPTPLTSGDLEILRNLVKAGKKSPKELQREQNYYREWVSGKWNEQDKENIHNEILERVTAAYQERYNGKLPPFLKDPFKVGDIVQVIEGMYRGPGEVIKVYPQYESAVVRYKIFNQVREDPFPYKHLRLLPKQIEEKAPEPEEQKRPYVRVKEELENLLSKFQPGNWHAFTYRTSPQGTKAERLIWLYKQRAQFNQPFPSSQEVMEKLDVDATSTSHILRILYERALQASTAEGARELLKKEGQKESPAVCPDHDLKAVAIDFDKTLSSELPDSDEPGPALPGAIDAVKKLKAMGFTIIINSHRVDHPKGLKQVVDWLEKSGCPYDRVWLTKPKADYYIDDKAVHFTNWEDVLNEIKQNEGTSRESAFMPTLPSQPLWDQRPDGGGAADYKYPLETLYPREWWDTWNAYTKMNAKVDPTILLKLLQKYKPVTKEDLPEEENLTKKAILNVDPDTAARFVIPRITFEIKTPEDISGEYEAVLLGEKPEASKLLFGVDKEDVRPPKKTPLEKLKKRFEITGPLPEEGEKAPIHFMPAPGRGYFYEEAPRPITSTGEVIYQVRYKKGPNAPAGVAIGYFNAEELLRYSIKKTLEENTVKEWLTNKVVSREPFIVPFFKRVKADTAKERFSWETQMYQDLISQDYGAAMEVADAAGYLTPKLKIDILGKYIAYLRSQQKFEEIVDIFKKYKLLESGSDLYSPGVAQDFNEIQTLAGQNLSGPASKEYAREASFILYGNEKYPKGGSILAKRKIIRDLGKEKKVKRIQEFLANPKFKEQPYGVQSATVRQFEQLGGLGEPGLWIVWEDAELPTSLRREALNSLVISHGVGAESRGYGEEGQKEAKDLLWRATLDKDPDIRSLAYLLMMDPRVGYLPWTAKGKLVYNQKDLQKHKEQPARDLAASLYDRFETESLPELRQAILSIIEELPKNIIKEEKPVTFAPDGTKISDGVYKFEEGTLPGFKALLVAALRDSDRHVRERVRTYFELPPEIRRPEIGEPKEFEVIKPSAEKFLKGAVDSINQDKLDEAQTYLDSAREAEDAPKFKDQIDNLQKRLDSIKYQKKVEQEEKPKPKVEEVKPKEEPPEETFEEPFEGPEGLQKISGPLSPIELESRQPPTTWPLSNPQTGYQAAFPLAPRDTGLLLKDVRQFFDRPIGKWRTDLKELWNSLLKLWNEEKQEEDAKKEKEGIKKIAKELQSPETKEQALKLLDLDLPEATKLAVDFFGVNSDEEGLLMIAGRTTNKQVLQQVLLYAKDKDLPAVVKAVFNSPTPTSPKSGDIKEEALDIFHEMNNVEELKNAVDSPWARVAIQHLASMGQKAFLKDKYKDADAATQLAIVFYLGREDVDFLTQALSSPHTAVREQAIEWLAYHRKFDILKQALEKEKDPTLKAIIERHLTLQREEPLSRGLEHLKPEEQDERIAELAQIATKAFTRWERYPIIRREAIEGRFGISSLNEWKKIQPEIDADIAERMNKIPSFEEGKEALRELKKIVESYDPTKKLKDWIAESEKRYDSAKKEIENLPEEERKEREEGLKELRDKIEAAKRDLEKFAKGTVEGLTFQVEQLDLMQTEALWRDTLIDFIRKDSTFKKEYGELPATWKDYQAYLKTFESDLFLPALGKETKEGVDRLKRQREDLIWKYTKPLRAEYSLENAKRAQLEKQLLPYYQRLRVPLEGKQPMPREVREIDKKIQTYRALQSEWFKHADVAEPVVEVDDTYYHFTPALWTYPTKGPAAMIEYAKGKRRIPEQVSELQSPYLDTIKELNRQKNRILDAFFKEIKEKLPSRAKELLLESRIADKRASEISKAIKQMGVRMEEGQFVAPSPKKDSHVVDQKQFETEKKKLLEKKEAIEKKEKEEKKPFREISPKDYLEYKIEVRDFEKRWGIPPIKEVPGAKVIEQYYRDRWRSPGLRGLEISPRYTPSRTVTPEEQAKKEQEAIEKYRQQMVKEYGPAEFSPIEDMEEEE